MQFQLNNNTRFPNVYANVTGDRPLSIVTNAQKFKFPDY